MQKNITINNVDCAKTFTKYGYLVTHKKIHGAAGGTMLDGSTTEDVIAIKASINLTLMPQTEEALVSFLKSLYGSDYAAVNYYDPFYGEYRNIEAIIGELEVKHTFVNVNGDDIWTFTTQLTLAER